MMMMMMVVMMTRRDHFVTYLWLLMFFRWIKISAEVLAYLKLVPSALNK